jgi:formiminotetrahydrofolate cyclodeaminase
VSLDWDEVRWRDLLAAIAAKTPTPGGGSVACMTAALAAALAEMVVNYSIGRKALAGHNALHHDAVRQLHELSDQARSLAQADARAYLRLNELWKLDANDELRRREFPGAVQAAIAAPSAALKLSVSLLRLLHQLISATNPQLKSDLAIAAVLADAAARSAAWNIRVNMPLLPNSRERQAMLDDTEAALSESAQLCATIERACAVHGR